MFVYDDDDYEWEFAQEAVEEAEEALEALQTRRCVVPSYIVKCHQALPPDGECTRRPVVIGEIKARRKENALQIGQVLDEYLRQQSMPYRVRVFEQVFKNQLNDGTADTLIGRKQIAFGSECIPYRKK